MLTQPEAEGIMENWKRQLIMDPTLNIILDTSQPAEVLVSQFIAKKEPEEISTIYSKLGTFKHSLTKHLKKQVELLAPIIIQNYHQTRQLRFTLDQTPSKRIQLIQARDFLHFYNDKYNQVETKTLQLKNCAKMLNFAKAYQKYIVQLKLLKSLTKGEQITNHLKSSELIHDIIESCSLYNFSGLKAYQSQRVEIGFLKQRLSKENDKILKEAINKKDEQAIISSIKVSYNLNTLTNTLRDYFNGNLSKIILETKKLFDPEKSFVSELESYGVIILKHSLDILNLQKLMHENGFSFFFDQFVNLKQLFGQFWKKIIQTFEKLSVKHLQQIKNGAQAQKSLKTSYPLIFSKVVNIVNQVNLHVILHLEDRLKYNFIQLREQFIRGLTPLASQYHQYIKETSATLIGELNKLKKLTEQTSESILGNINQSISELLSKVSDTQLFLEIIQKCCIPILQKLKIMIQEPANEGLSQQLGLSFKKLLELFKETILSSKVSYSMTLQHLQHFQLLPIATK